MIVSFVLLLFSAAFFGQGSAYYDCSVEARVNETHSWVPHLPDKKVKNSPTNFVAWKLHSREIYDSDVHPSLLLDDYSVWAPFPYTYLSIPSAQRNHSGIYFLYSDYTYTPWACRLEVHDVPKFNYIKFLHGEDVRPSRSSGGFVDGRDRIVIEFSFTTHRDDFRWYPYDAIHAQKNLVSGNGYFTNKWANLSSDTCVFDLYKCPEPEGPGTKDCYCKIRTSEFPDYTFTLIYNATVNFENSGKKLRFIWNKKNQLLREGVWTDALTLPVICKQANVTFTTQGEKRVAGSELHTVEKIPGNTSLTFSVTNLIAPYSIQIGRKDKNGTLAFTTNGTSVTTFVSDADVGKVYKLSYNESSSTGCGRYQSISLTYT